MSNIRVVQPGQRRTRHQRQPNFPIAGGMRPFGVYPNFFTPVLPGETLTQARINETVVSSPVESPLTGAWFENWLFYVKLTDIDRALAGMFIGELESSSGYTAASDKPRYFTKSGELDWCYMCAEVVHNHFFLDANETARTTDNVFMAKRIVRDFTESALKHTTDDDVSLPSSQEDVVPQLQAYLAMRQMGMASFDYDDYLKTYGVQTVKTEEGEPELIAYRRYWTLPSNVIDPTDGSPSGAWYWRVDEKHEKNVRFKEPGFIIGLQAVRPKMLDSTQKSSMANQLWGFQDWFPSYTLEDPSAGIRVMDVDAQTTFEGVGEGTNTYDLWLDHRDLLSHGEQFINAASRLTVPTVSDRSFADGATDQEVRGLYATETDIDNLFTTATAAERVCDYEGLIGLRIKGHVQDTT